MFSVRDSWDTKLHAGPLYARDFISSVSKSVIADVKDSAGSSSIERAQKLKEFEETYNVSVSFDPTKPCDVEVRFIH